MNRTVLGTIGAVLGVANAVFAYRNGNIDATLGWSCSVAWAISYLSIRE